jgi:hypothetical protein
MPIQKDLKKIVRTRMQKTGEAYTTARLHVVRNKEKEAAPPPNYAELAGMSDETVKKATGHDWAAWVKTLDAAQAAEKPHREIAQYVKSLGTADWWTQSVTVGYERIRGLREKGQRRGGGYEASKSRTFAVPVETLFEAVAKAPKRKRWLPVAMKVRTSTPHKTIRASFDDGTLAQFYFVDKGGKSTLTVQHQKLADKEAVNRTKQSWSERFDALAELLGK